MRALVASSLLALALAGCLAPAAPLEPSGPAGFSDTAVFPGDYDKTGFVSRPLRAGVYKALPAEVVDLPSDVDGELMQVGLVRPDVPEGMRVPVIAAASPYYPPMRPGKLDGVDLYSVLPHGYALAFIAVRGTADNTGCMEYFGPNERADLDQAVRWLGEQSWSSGRVGMFGGSYDGGTQWMVAAAGNPYLKTIVPVAGVTDPWRLLYSNGTASNRGAWHPTNYWLMPGIFGPWTVLDDRSPDRHADALMCPEAAERLVVPTQTTLAPARDAFWQARTFWPDVVANYEGSVFLIQGLQDWNVHPSQQWPWLRQLGDKGLMVKQLVGQWVHTLPDLRTGVEPERLTVWGVPYLLSPHVLDYAFGNPHARWDFAEMLLRWYDYWLQGNTTLDLGPRVEVEDSAGRWRVEQDWPPRDAATLALYLTPDGGLAEEPAQGSAKLVVGASQHLLSTFDTGRAGLQDLCAGATCATFTGAVQPDLRISGLPQVRLRVTPTGPGGQLAAYLYSLNPAGTQRLSLGSLDLRYADGGETARAVAPGQPLDVVIQLEPTDAVLPAGSRLQLVITQGAESDHATALEIPGAAAPMQLEVGGEAGALLLPTIARGPEAFFEPP